ncbi:hypothetical protein HFP15_21035 [Amycolatopsis sp. K13G38]|uniref:Phosphate transport system regulatory protein PhoU n=1 Tax=Amycolatopsis acididurans TaxID=2724524 RepID=A0ABX1JAK1_9PSEU|nr:hypothetical protein [Amycolatopsis acididurans]NKQ55375.1 hypothetical protein [Amycolatopsis acididurans]
MENVRLLVESDSTVHVALQVERASRLYELLDDAVSTLNDVERAVAEVGRDDLVTDASIEIEELEDLRVCVDAAALATRNAIRVTLPYLARARKVAAS